MAEIKTGKIVAYHPNRGRGQVLLEDGKEVSFGAGAFDSGWPARAPRTGDPVDVRLWGSSGEPPLYVRLRKPTAG